MMVVSFPPPIIQLPPSGHRCANQITLQQHIIDLLIIIVLDLHDLIIDPEVLVTPDHPVFFRVQRPLQFHHLCIGKIHRKECLEEW